ncbi:transcription initiation factor IIA subunit 1 [Lepeophtheirus salmonis]|uniref:Transcription initiation factor IIA subunit 1 n=1 Tax=Lepeophtheirus salmonis TaxID=72036 RepID=C1BTM5_LEPSM|nr:transcription initiation factor IIA subunit 1-like [Lepeophtheirus salmonis]ACO12378.1 Transcription initiation factor IIA subunit 1 [Lepeophtheirus salmonis]ADD37929.1 Transcription initiation factor IIA subunit 1 [Lepeophtheirus salmonis]
MSERTVTSAASLYHSVIADVVNAVREPFLDDGVDENVLQELKTLWSNKLDASKTIEPPQPPAPPPPPSKSATEALLESKLAASRNSGASAPPPSMPHSSSGTIGQQLVITDPNRLVPVQITIPAQPGNPNSVPRSITVHVPAHALQQNGPTSAMLQRVLTQAITKALTLPETHSAVFLQNQINTAFKLT